MTLSYWRPRTGSVAVTTARRGTALARVGALRSSLTHLELRSLRSSDAAFAGTVRRRARQFARRYWTLSTTFASDQCFSNP